MIAIIDYGMGNLFSVEKAFVSLGAKVVVTSVPEVILNADKVVLPGVGAFGDCMSNLTEVGLVDVIHEVTTRGTPFLGICLGMQLLFDDSAEGPTQALGLIPGTVALLPDSPGITVPHMGWNTIQWGREIALLDGLAPDARFYFVHSYAAPVNAFTLASCNHGAPFTAIVQRGNFSGVQFHPERSGAAGARLLKNFVEGRV